MAWDPIVAEREREKRIKYQGLAAVIAGQPVHICMVVIGALGTVCQMGHNLVHSGLLEADDVWRLAGSIQMSVLIRGKSSPCDSPWNHRAEHSEHSHHFHLLKGKSILSTNHEEAPRQSGKRKVTSHCFINLAYTNT